MKGAVAQVTKRTVRGLALWRSRRAEMEALGGGVWLVPSASREEQHRVSLLEEQCSCRDAVYHPEHRCKHGWAVIFELALRRALGLGVDDLYGGNRAPGRRPR